MPLTERFVMAVVTISLDSQSAAQASSVAKGDTKPYASQLLAIWSSPTGTLAWPVEDAEYVVGQ